QPNKDRVSNVVDALHAVTELAGNVVPPAWIDNNRDRPPAAEILPCANGLLHLTTWQLSPHTPLFFGMNVLPYAYSPAAPKPTQWLRFLDSLWDGDPETISTLQEWFGYSLTFDVRQHKMLLLIGPTRSGKGTIAAVLKALLGEANVCGPTIESL